ncbi:hypothetical protein [Stakelama tenebrarum]|uniref:Uncharacterized protein n=1 Tax=Stakelama tenebrarum TaxID=2711215 RepID=A0A6G6Y3A0_9SPHN|nr:hypothetical protein [Sphingosinithalassobacter tenebrarum]QIG79287.1 hypothetical protein G5C33_05410 [Sphingosinithalassobacter tenebrarum]
MATLSEHLHWHVAQAWHLRRARGILATPPIVPRDDGVILYSMIGTRVLLPYLVAVKSLHARLGRGRVVILDDGTLTAADRRTLDHHLGNPEIHGIASVDLGGCPPKSCWERLLLLLELRRDHYVIQLDSDTVTLGPVPEVADAIDAGRDFTLRGESDSEWMPLDAFLATRPDVDPCDPATHIQAAAEAILGRVDAGLPADRHYVRGCAGFAGFAPGGLGPDVARAFSAEAEALLGRDNWKRWGSEQVMSNVIIANEGPPVLLPYDRYLNYWNEPLPGDAAFVHFIGTYRFHRGAYVDATLRASRSLAA